MHTAYARRIRAGIERARFEASLFGRFGVSVQRLRDTAARELDPDPLAERAYWRALHSIQRSRTPRWHRGTWRAAA